MFGLEKVDPQIRRLAELNEILAYKPWAVSKEHIHSLLKGGSNCENLTIQKILKACVILTTYHGLCGLSMGMGILPDDDIREEMTNLFGEEALQLCVIPKEKGKDPYHHLTSDTGGDADESSMASNSRLSGNLIHDEQSEKLFKKLMKKQQNKKAAQEQNKQYLSESSEEQNAGEEGYEQGSHTSLNDHFEEMKFDDLENMDEVHGDLNPTEMNVKDKPRMGSTRQPELGKMYDLKQEQKQDPVGTDTKMHLVD